MTSDWLHEPREKARSRLEKKTSKIMLSGRFLATVVGLSTLDMFFTHAPPTVFWHLSVCFLLSAYFLAAACYKRMCLTTSFYGTLSLQILYFLALQLFSYYIQRKIFFRQSFFLYSLCHYEGMDTCLGCARLL